MVVLSAELLCAPSAVLGLSMRRCGGKAAKDSVDEYFGDTSVSDTPRTDKFLELWRGSTSIPHAAWCQHAYDLEQKIAALREALERIRDECFNGAAYDIAVSAIGEFKKGSP